SSWSVHRRPEVVSEAAFEAADIAGNLSAGARCRHHGTVRNGRQPRMIGRKARQRGVVGLALAMLLAALTPAAGAEPSRLDRIRERGHLVCGIKTGIPGFAMIDAQGRHI